jgi:hypothetical protein
MSDLPFSLLDNRWLLVTALMLLALLVIGFVGGRIQRRRRSRDLALGLGDSTRGVLIYSAGPGSPGFTAEIQPSPDPFAKFSIEHRGGSNPFFAWAGNRESLRFRAKLQARPVAELLWVRGKLPPVTSSLGMRVSMWVQRRLDYLNVDYAVRGSNTAAVEHVFLDLQTRFGQALRLVRIYGDEEPDFEVVIRSGRLDGREMPALVTTLRALGRGALRG